MKRSFIKAGFHQIVTQKNSSQKNEVNDIRYFNVIRTNIVLQ